MTQEQRDERAGSEEGTGRVVAAFDFDGTLSTRSNVLPFFRAAAGIPRLVVALIATFPQLVGGALAERWRDSAKVGMVRHTLTGYDADRLHDVAARFADQVVDRHMRADALERARWHRDQGHEVVIVSASFAVYLVPIAQRLGFAAALGTELEIGSDGRLTGELAGANVRRAEKARRLDAWLGDRPAFVWAYGDSTGDRELFERADRAIKVGRRSFFPRRGRTS